MPTYPLTVADSDAPDAIRALNDLNTRTAALEASQADPGAAAGVVYPVPSHDMPDPDLAAAANDLNARVAGTKTGASFTYDTKDTDTERPQAYDAVADLNARLTAIGH